MTLPRTAQGEVQLDVFLQHLRFLLEAGVQGVVLNGATGEYCLTSASELQTLLREARKVAGSQAHIIAAIGGASVAQTLLRLQAAESSGADGLLLPMPYFFPYAQQDVVAYVEQVAARASLPVLLYNLPEFTTPLEPATTLQLVQSTARVQGIKDSSGSLETLRLLASSAPAANRVIGNDGALHGALAEGLCDGVVSGVASALPELMLAYYTAVRTEPWGGTALLLKGYLDEVLEWLGRFPVPWGLKIIAEERGFFTADFALPLSPQREAAAREFRAWFQGHRAELLAESSLQAPAPVETKELA